MQVPDTYAATCARANELCIQGRHQEALDLHYQYRIKAADRGDKGWSLPSQERARRALREKQEETYEL